MRGSKAKQIRKSVQYRIMLNELDNDTAILEAVYEKMLPWIPGHPHVPESTYLRIISKTSVTRVCRECKKITYLRYKA